MLSHALPLQWKGESKEEEENIVICSLILARLVQDTHSHKLTRFLLLLRDSWLAVLGGHTSIIIRAQW